MTSSVPTVIGRSMTKRLKQGRCEDAHKYRGLLLKTCLNGCLVKAYLLSHENEGFLGLRLETGV